MGHQRAEGTGWTRSQGWTRDGAVSALGDTVTRDTSKVIPSRIDAATASSLAGRLLDVSKLEPQPRGYAFEKFLKEMFDAYGLSARASFRLAKLAS